MSKRIVVKFGGSSLKTRDDIENVGRVMREEESRRHLVLSAPAGVTDLLIDLSKSRDRRKLDEIISIYESITRGNEIDYIANKFNEALTQDLPYPAYKDNMISTGERTLAPLAAQILGFEYVPAEKMFLVSSDFGSAKILPKSRERVRARLQNSQNITVTDGFNGITEDGFIATLGREGSDKTAAALALFIEADEMEKRTGTDGVFEVDPAIVPYARKLDQLTYRETRDLTNAGASILHAEVAEYLQAGNIVLHVRNARKSETGTIIGSHRVSDRPVAGIAYNDGFCIFNVHRIGLGGQHGVYADVLNVFKQNKVGVDYSPSENDDISVVLQQEPLRDIRLLTKIKKELAEIVGTGTEISYADNVSTIVIAGQDLPRDRDAVPKMLSAIRRARINKEFSTEGMSQMSYVIGVLSEDGHDAVRAVYDALLK